MAGQSIPTWTCVDPLAGITIRIPIERADAPSLAAAMRPVQALGAAPTVIVADGHRRRRSSSPTVIVSDLWAASPEALAQVWPRAERHLCWFHVMQWGTRKLAALLKAYGETLAADDRKLLHRAARICRPRGLSSPA